MSIESLEKWLENANIPDGTCYIDKLSISFLNGSNWGYDSKIEASGYMYENGEASLFYYNEIDVSLSDFLNANEKIVFVGEGELSVYDELISTNLQTTIDKFNKCRVMFSQFDESETISSAFYSPEYDKLVQIVMLEDEMEL